MNNLGFNKFWNWFLLNERRFRGDSFDDSFLKELDERVFDLNPRLGWELMEDGDGSILIISPEFDKSIITLAENVVQFAPVIEGWQFINFRPPKFLNKRFDVELGELVVEVDMNVWQFVFLNYKDEGTELLLVANKTLSKELLRDEDKIWTLGAVILSGILGEEFVAKKLDSWSVVNEAPEYLKGSLKKLVVLKKFFGLE